MFRHLKKVTLFLFFISLSFCILGQSESSRTNKATLFKQGSVWGVLNLNGEILVEPQYSRVKPFKDGYAKVGSFKFVNTKGEVFDVKKHLEKLSDVGQFSDGLLAVNKRELGLH